MAIYLVNLSSENSLKINLDIFGVVKKCTITVDVILREPETEV